MDIQAVLEQLRTIQPELRQRFGVSGLWVFGSYVRGEANEESDLDVLVEFDRSGMTLLRFIELEMFIGDNLGRKIDLVQRSALRPNLKSAILAEAIAV
jgi:predicted nucleotidyltransferase